MNKLNLILVVISLLFISCSPKLSKKSIREFQPIQNELKSLRRLSNVSKINKKYSDFNIYHTLLPIHKVKTKLEKEALSLKKYEMTKLVLNKNKTCGFIKLIHKGKDSLLRVKYIYLQDKSEHSLLAETIISKQSRPKYIIG